MQFLIFLFYFDRIKYNFEVLIFNYYFDRINWIIWIIFLYLKFPEEIPNEQSATPKRETFVQKPEGTLVTSDLSSNSFLLFIGSTGTGVTPNPVNRNQCGQ